MGPLIGPSVPRVTAARGARDRCPRGRVGRWRLGCRRLAGPLLAAIAVTVCDPARLSGQTPEQRYADWVRRGFRPQEYEFRRNRIIDGLRATGGGLLLVPSSDGLTHGETFRQLEDFWYLTGLEVVQSMLVLDAERGLATLFMPERDPRFENPGRPNDFPGRPLLDDFQLRGVGGADDYRDIAELEAFLRDRTGAGQILRVNAGAPGEVPDPVVPLIGSLDATASLTRRLRDDYPETDLVNTFETIARLRMVKSPAEIMRMRRAADATMRGMRAAAALVRPGVDERTLQGEFERACREAGAQSIPFTPIIKSGPNSLWPWRVLAAHYDRRNRRMADGDLVILDVGCEVNGYVSDVGRTFPVSGAFTDVQREKLLVSTRAAEAVIAAVRPGVTLRELTRVAYDAIPDEEERYMQTASFFGHHIGLSAGDPALLDEPLSPGMVFTVEPWYYNHDLGVSVFVEEVVLVTEDGAEILTEALPRDPEALEALVP